MTNPLRVRRAVGALLAMALAAAFATHARAEEPRAGKTHVIMVGVSEYADKDIKPRTHAEADAKSLYELFTDKKNVQGTLGTTTLLLGKDATRDKVLDALKKVAADAAPEDLVLFGFFGQGGPLNESGERRAYFTADSTFKERAKNALAASDIQEALKPLKANRFSAFVDVNFKGYAGAGMGGSEASLGKAPYDEFLGDDGTEEHNPNPGRVIFLATNGLSQSVDGDKHGIFEMALADAFGGKADKEGYEPDGVITVDEVTEYLDKAMADLARTHGKTKEEKQQLHFVIGGRGTHYVLSRNPEAAGKAQERVTKLEAMIKEGKLPAKYADEARTLIARMPKLEGQRSLRKEYQALVDSTTTLEKFEAAREKLLEAAKLKRTDAVEYAKKVIEASQIIRDNYVKDVNQGDLVTNAIKGLYRRLDEKVPAELEARLKDAKTLKEGDLAILLADARQALGTREDLEKQKDLHITLQRMLVNLDPYTTYIDPETVAKFKVDIDAQFTGIGIQIRKDFATDMLVVVSPIRNSPAYKAGIEAGDLVVQVRREEDSQGKKLDKPEVIETKGLALNDAVKKIMGLPGTKVKLVIQREGENKTREIEITRARINVETVMGAKRDKQTDDWDYWADQDKKIGYIRLTSFSRTSYADLKNVVQTLQKQGMKAFVLDLRFNPGGLLDSAVKISDLFIDDGLIVSIRPRQGREAKFTGTSAGSMLDFPMVCLVNGGSASGSEIVSAALQDHKRAIIFGERSYGKGSVQNIQDFEGGELKFTTATFWRPSGKNLNKSSTGGKDEDEWGVRPDKAVALTKKERDELAEHQHDLEIIQPKTRKVETKDFKDKQLEAALEYLRGQIK